MALPFAEPISARRHSPAARNLPAPGPLLTDESGLWVVGVDNDDALVAGVDVHQRAFHVLLQLARVDVHLRWGEDVTDHALVKSHVLLAYIDAFVLAQV